MSEAHQFVKERGKKKKKIPFTTERCLPIHIADICVHQIVIHIVKVMQWNTAAKAIEKN